MKQVALGVHSAHDTLGRLPPVAGFSYGGAYCAPFFFHVLPFVEQRNVWGAATAVPGGGVIPLWNTPGPGGAGYLRQTRVKTYQCPSDATIGTNPAGDWTPGDASYAPNFQVFGNPNFNAGTTVHADWDGMTTLTAITDGTSNTIAVAEKLAYCPGTAGNGGATFAPMNGAHQHGGSWWLRGVYNSGTVSGTSPPSATDSYPGDRVSPVFGGGRGGDGTLWYTGANAKPTVFGIPKGNTTSGPCDRGLASSPHTGLIVVGLCDGSVRSVSSGIDAPTWWAACTRNGGEPAGNW